MEHAPLAGCSILVVEAEPFIARCLQVLLEGGGAEVHSTGSGAEALHFVDLERLSGAVLDYATSAKDDHRVPHRLTALRLPFVFCRDISGTNAWPRTPALNKPVIGAQLVETLRRLLRPGLILAPAAPGAV